VHDPGVVPSIKEGSGVKEVKEVESRKDKRQGRKERWI
jgi:hypothetical protein